MPGGSWCIRILCSETGQCDPQFLRLRIRKFQKMFGDRIAEAEDKALNNPVMGNLKNYLLLGFLIRLCIIIYGHWHDAYLEVPFTDVDYKVFTDAARHVVSGDSPYKRHTYRYPPVLAWLLTPNVFLHESWGKLLFSVVDILVSVLIYRLVKIQGYSDKVARNCSFTWVFNPLSIIIATRGNSDAIIALVVLLSVYYLLKNEIVLSGVSLALAIHIRLYPLVFSLPLYLSIKSDLVQQPSSNGNFADRLVSVAKRAWFRLVPDRRQLSLVISCVSTLLLLSLVCYSLYGFEYVQESILFHLTRKDTRHNFSVYFYLLYLEPQQASAFMFFPQLLLLVMFSLVFGNKSTISFCLFLETFAIVTYNPVSTSQYFIWYLSLLPPNLPRFNLTLRQAGILCSLWIFSQLTWLIPAYLLEYRGRNTFLYIWFQCIGFFCANLAIMVRLIKSYNNFNRDHKKD